METTVTLEFIAESQEHLSDLEHQFKQIHGIQVLLVQPRDESAPALISLGINKKSEQLDTTIRRIVHIIYSALHRAEGPLRQSTLVTIEGNSIDITALSDEKIKEILADAVANQ